ncbi:MAG: general secretion pathway protein GspK [Verrucomicrobia bacterium]|nr:general secretion pathway protein GspK [Verrucomicrobiota bacterium]
MRTSRSSNCSGIALIIVMVVILALAVLAGGFAYSMKVELKLARNSESSAELDWIGRSGVEYAKWVLGQQMGISSEPFDSLNQKWAGGPGGTGASNTPLQDVSLTDVALGEGKFSVKIVDLERKFNINTADQMILQQGLILMGVDASLFPTVTDSIADWIDKDDNRHLSGAESDYYLALKPSYYAKNGPLDDLSELLLIQGITPNMYWGPRAPSHQNQGRLTKRGGLIPAEEPVYPVGFVDLFTTLSARFVNINTAPSETLQMIPGIDANMAAGIIRHRAGPDGAEGTDDDTPFRSVGELINVPGMTSQAVQFVSQRQIFSVRSVTFEVTVTAEIGAARRDFVAIIRRASVRDLQVLSFYGK